MGRQSRNVTFTIIVYIDKTNTYCTLFATWRAFYGTYLLAFLFCVNHIQSEIDGLVCFSFLFAFHMFNVMTSTFSISRTSRLTRISKTTINGLTASQAIQMTSSMLSKRENEINKIRQARKSLGHSCNGTNTSTVSDHFLVSQLLKEDMTQRLQQETVHVYPMYLPVV